MRKYFSFIRETVMKFDVNGITVDAEVRSEDLEGIYLPLLRKMTRMQKEKRRRLVVYLAAPPGCGKSTTASLLQYLSEQNPEIEPLQALGIDGFHFGNDYLRTHQTVIDGETVDMIRVKGNPVTFDTDKLHSSLAHIQDPLISWPVYSRIAHAPVENAVSTDRKIILLEGNYLLYDDIHWTQLLRYCDLKLFMTADDEILKKRLTERKCRSGFSRTEAERFYDYSDGRNVKLVKEHSAGADYVLTVDGNQSVISVQGGTLQD